MPTPVFGIPYPEATDKAYLLAPKLKQLAEGLEAALLAAGVPPVVTTNSVVAATAAARDTYFGVPANAAARVALQNRAPICHRTDKGWSEKYFAAITDSAGNLGGMPVAGWYPTSVGIQRVYAQRYAGTTAAGAAIAGSTLTVKRRAFKQRIIATWSGSFASSGPTVGALQLVVGAGGTIIVAGGETVVVGGSGVIFSGMGVAEIPAGAGADINVNLISSFSSAVAQGTVRYDVLVEGEF